MTPIEHHLNILNIVRKAIGPCGADLFAQNFKTWSKRSILAVFAGFIYFSFAFYTAYVTLLTDSWTGMLECVCTIGTAVQGYTKYASAVIDREKYLLMCDDLSNIYRDYQTAGEDYEMLLNSCLNSLDKVAKFGKVLYFFVVCTLVLTPLIVYYINGEITLPIFIFIPGLNPYDRIGYPTNFALQLLFFFYGSFGNYGGDLLFLIQVVNTWIYGGILKIKIIEANKEISKNNTKNDEATLKDIMKDIYKFHQRYSWYTSTLNDMYSWVAFVLVGTSTFSMSLTLLIIMIGGWPASYAYFLLAFATLAIYCGLGTIVEVVNGIVCDSINESLWYILPSTDQKCFGFLMAKAQAPKNLEVGGFMPLNANTGLKAMKTIYSYMMLLLQFIET